MVSEENLKPASRVPSYGRLGDSTTTLSTALSPLDSIGSGSGEMSSSPHPLDSRGSGAGEMAIRDEYARFHCAESILENFEANRALAPISCASGPFWAEGPSYRNSHSRITSAISKQSLSMSMTSEWGDGELSNLSLLLFVVPLTPNTYAVLSKKPEGLRGNLKNLDIFSGPRAEFRKGERGINPD